MACIAAVVELERVRTSGMEIPKGGGEKVELDGGLEEGGGPHDVFRYVVSSGGEGAKGLPDKEAVTDVQ